MLSHRRITERGRSDGAGCVCVCLASAMLAACGSGAMSRTARPPASGTAHLVNGPRQCAIAWRCATPMSISRSTIRQRWSHAAADRRHRPELRPGRGADGQRLRALCLPGRLCLRHRQCGARPRLDPGRRAGARHASSAPPSRIIRSSRRAPGGSRGYDSYGWRFTATAPGIGGEPPVQIYGRGDLILPPGASRGVTLVSLATSRAGRCARRGRGRRTRIRSRRSWTASIWRRPPHRRRPPRRRVRRRRMRWLADPRRPR